MLFVAIIFFGGYTTYMNNVPLPKSLGRQFRSPSLEDGPLLHELATVSGGLDVNTAYAYLLPGLHHASASVLAEMDGQPVGFVSGYHIPDLPDGNRSTHGTRLFIWQIAIHPDYRGLGFASDMLAALLARPANAHVTHLDTSITLSNAASLRLFTALAKRLGAPIAPIATLGAHLFPTGHEAETLYRIGPFTLSHSHGEKR